MLIFSVRLYVYAWCGFLSFLSVLFLFIFTYHITSDSSFMVTFDLFDFSLFSFTFVILSDVYSSLFSFSVSLISLVVFLFSFYYFDALSKLSYFIWVTFFFVLSILLLINFSDLFFVILGWDGLGLVSFLLILFYQSPTSVFSSIFTLLMNRLGDCLLVLTIIFFSVSSCFLGFSFSFMPLSVVFFLVLAFITKSALFPFSPWLPAAMAAPTPISSLVHSSTLVTAGLYLMMRNFYYIRSTPEVLGFLQVVGLFTSFYAGCSSLVESDLKKIVALSTLSHLGFICFSLGLGWCHLAFFHLLSHAFFKSTLFMAVGIFIVNHLHYQDRRYHSSLVVRGVLPSSVILISEANLLGFPFLRGFYSKDYVLESFSYSFIGAFLVIVTYFNLIFTYSYSLRILSSLFSFNKLAVFSIARSEFFTFFVCLSFLSFFSVFFGWFFVSFFYLPPFFISSFLKFIPLSLLRLCFIFYLTFYNSTLILPSFFIYFFTGIAFLSPIWSNLSSRVYFIISSLFSRSVERGYLQYFLVGGLVSVFFEFSRFIMFLYTWSFRVSVLYLFIFRLLFFIWFV